MNTLLSNAAFAWWTAGILAAAYIIGWVRDWISRRWEIARHRPVRRWYGSAAHVCLRSDAEDDDPERYAVLDWWDGNPALPWLWVVKLDPQYLTYWDEDAEAFWAPVTEFAPYAVRRIRPCIWHFGRVPLPWLTKWCLMSGADLGERRPPLGLPGDQLELAPAGLVPPAPGEPVAQVPLQHGREPVPGRVGDDLDGVHGAPVAEHLEVECTRPAAHGSHDNPRTGG